MMHCHLPSAQPAQQDSISQHQIYPTIHLLSVPVPFSISQSDHKGLPLFLTLNFSLLEHQWEPVLLWWQVTAGASGCSHWFLLHMLTWIRKSPNCKRRCKCTETNGLTLPHPSPWVSLANFDHLLFQPQGLPVPCSYTWLWVSARR